MKAIMISIRPQYVADILNGKKTLEIRKTLPKCKLPIEVYIYVTQGKPFLFPMKEKPFFVVNNNVSKYGSINGKVVAKFTLKKVGNFSKEVFGTYEEPFTYNQDDLLKKSCLTEKELDNYLKGKTGYAWHIDNLVVFDKPKEISEFKQEYNYFLKNKTCSGCPCVNCEDKGCCSVKKPLTRAPQSWCYVEV